jgi:hypothetical protein
MVIRRCGCMGKATAQVGEPAGCARMRLFDSGRQHLQCARMQVLLGYTLQDHRQVDAQQPDGVAGIMEQPGKQASQDNPMSVALLLIVFVAIAWIGVATGVWAEVTGYVGDFLLQIGGLVGLM